MCNIAYPQMDGLKKKISYEFSGRVIVSLLAALLSIFLARYLGPDSYGLFRLALSLFAIIAIFVQWGIPKSAARYISITETDSAKANIILFSLIYNILLGLLATAFLFVGKDIIIDFFDEPRLRPLLFLGVLYLFTSVVEYNIRYAFQGLNVIKYSSLVNIFSGSGRFFVVTTLVLLGFGVQGAFIGYISGSVISALIGVYFLKRIINRFSLDFDKGLQQRILKYSVPIGFMKISDSTQRIDELLIAFYIGPAAVGVYSVCKQITKFLEIPAATVGFSIAPSFGFEDDLDQKNTAKKAYQNLLEKILLFYFPVCMVIAVISEDVLLGLFGSEYVNGTKTLQILMLFVLFRSISKLTNSSIDYMGRAKYRSYAMFVVLIILISGNIIFIPVLGIEGAAMTTVLAYGIYSLTTVIILHMEVSLKTPKIITIVFKGFLMSILFGAISFGLSELFSGLLLFGVAMVVCATLWSTIMYVNQYYG
ncbi:flippase [Halobacteria archaeon AArc-m2/3/4]|uniref:Flippase n=1 Tax=Natronoglomus mannanivorans TaxID=2979990 RepID=A0ABT2QKA3_9EURY|nr:flippase [Halobacteria archaeon AArc-m2/3/4]